MTRGVKWDCPCSVDGCGRPAQTRGMCKSHYIRWYHGKPLDAPFAKFGRGQRYCQVAGCDKPHESHGYCAMHWYRFRTGGPMDLGPIPPRYKKHRSGIKWGTDAAVSVNYYSAHQRVKKLWGSAKNFPCVECGRPAIHWAYDRTDSAQLLGATSSGSLCHYSAFPEFYMPMCAKCHKAFDVPRAKQQLQAYRSIAHVGKCDPERIAFVPVFTTKQLMALAASFGPEVDGES